MTQTPVEPAPARPPVEIHDDGAVRVLRLNRPERLNAINPELSQELAEAFYDFRDDPEVWVAIITGTGERAFSAGADLKDMAASPDAGVSRAARARRAPLGGITRGPTIWKPIIAAINGYATGAGLEVALACDIRICADHAQFGLPEVRWSLIAAGGGNTRLPRAVPRAVAMKLLLTGGRLNAQQALQWGLVTDVVPLADLMPLAHRIADTVLENAPLAVQGAKEIAYRTLEMPLDEGLAFEQAIAAMVRATEDRKEGPRAFAEKRKPNYKGR